LECAKILRLLLDLIHGKLHGSFNAINCADGLDLIRLAEKYECATLLKTISLFIENPVGAAEYKYYRFFYACALDDADAAHRLLVAAANTHWPASASGKTVSVEESVDGANGLDLTGMSVAWIDRLPRKYFLALLRASRLRASPKLESWQAVADEFKIQVDLQSKSVS
jgi:hypothetical protein